MPSLKRRPVTAIVALIVTLAGFPLGALASHDFADVPDSNPFHADVSALAASGVTTGCGGGNYCPSAFVTREQMAAFMNRLGALSAGKSPVVNADRLDGMDSTEFLAPGEIVHTQLGPWVLNASDVGSGISHYSGSTRATRAGAGLARVLLHADGVRSEHGVGYGFKELELCFLTSSNSTLSSVSINEFSPTGSSLWSLIATADVALDSPQCFTYARSPSALLGTVSVFLTIDLSAAGYAVIGTATWTWAPV